MKEGLDKEKEEDWLSAEPKLEVLWGLQVEARPTLMDGCVARDLEDEIEWIQSTLVSVLKNVRQTTICARSKRWWNEDLKDKRQQLGRTFRWKRGGTATASQAAVKEGKKALRTSIRSARRECWEEYPNRADGDDIWAITRYVNPQRSAGMAANFRQNTPYHEVAPRGRPSGLVS